MNDRHAIRSEAKFLALSLFNEAALKRRSNQVSRGRHLGLLPLTRPNKEILVRLSMLDLTTWPSQRSRRLMITVSKGVGGLLLVACLMLSSTVSFVMCRLYVMFRILL